MDVWVWVQWGKPDGGVGGIGAIGGGGTFFLVGAEGRDVSVILIVDDFRDGAEALCRLLTRRGYWCSFTTSSEEALNLARGHPPEQPLLVVTDEMMPHMTGMDLVRAMRASPRTAE